MKKSIFTIALVAVALVTSSGYNKSVVGLDPGNYAPELSLNNDSVSLSLDDCRGKYVLLTFWSASDALSRQQCNQYNAWVNDLDGKVEHIAVNLDSETDVFNQVVRLDNLDSSAQFNVQGALADKISADYRLDGGFGSVLISPDGRISMFNPSNNDLSAL